MGSKFPGGNWGRSLAIGVGALAGFVIGQKGDNVIGGMDLVSANTPDPLKPSVGKFVGSLFTPDPFDTPMEAAKIRRAYGEYQELMSGGGGYNAAVGFVQKQVPTALKPAWEKMTRELDALAVEKKWDDSQKLDALQRGYTDLVDRFASYNPTYVSMSEGPLGDMARNSNIA